MVPKNLDIRDVFPQTHGNTHVYPHENAKMARELVCVSSPHHHRAWKRVCVKNVFFFCVSSKLKSVAVVYRSSTPEPLFLPETLQISRSKAKETTCSGKNGTSQNHMTVAKQKYKS